MKILFCGIYCDDNMINDILSQTQKLPFAQLRLEKMLLDGFERAELNTTDVLSVRPFSRWPRFRKIFVKSSKTENKFVNIDYIGFVNLPIIKQLCVFINTFISQFNWINKNKKQKQGILIYGTNPLICLPALINRVIFKIPIIVYVTEIDSLRVFPLNGYINKIKKIIYISFSKFVENSFDGYILITEKMLEKINRKNKPYCIIEGMVQVNPLTQSNFNNNNSISRYVLYAGSLHKKYGIATLIEGFIKSNKKDFKLVIFGSGDYEEQIKAISKNESSVIFKGTALNDTILEYEKNAYLLVNPRPSNEELTKYSFPSKTLEYFSSGTPALITKLEGIPEEYYKFCFFFDDESVYGFAKKISEILSLSETELTMKSEQAKQFVNNEKNNYTQCNKILHFISTIVDKEIEQ